MMEQISTSATEVEHEDVGPAGSTGKPWRLAIFIPLLLLLAAFIWWYTRHTAFQAQPVHMVPPDQALGAIKAGVRLALTRT